MFHRKQNKEHMHQQIMSNNARLIWVMFTILLIGNSCTPTSDGSKRDQPVATNEQIHSIDTLNCFTPEDIERLSSSLAEVESKIKQNLALPSRNLILELLPKDDETYFISELQKSYCKGTILNDIENNPCIEKISIYVDCFRDNVDADGNFEEFMSIFILKKNNGIITFDYSTAAG